MQSHERILDRLHLENGLEVYFIDQSSPPVVGRCQVRLLVRVPVEPAEEHFGKYPNPSAAYHQFISLVGSDPLEFRAVKIRNFIDRKDVGKTLEEMKDDFIRSSLLYLKKPGFAANFVTRKHEEILAGAAARSARDRALRDAERQ